MNHRWDNGTCIHCGLTRKRKDYRRLVNTRTILTRHGVWEDRPVYKFGSAWWYGEKHQFERPDCKRTNS